MSFKLPPNGQWTQKNVGDATGSLWSSFNLDLTRKQGDTKITRLIHNASTSSDLANLGTPVGFCKFASALPYFTVAGSRVFKQNSQYPSSDFVQESGTGTPTNCSSSISDLAGFNGYLYVTTDSANVYKTSGGGTWSNFSIGLTISTRMLCQYADRLYCSNGNTIISWDTADTVATSGQYTLTLPSTSMQIIFMRAASDKIWIGVKDSRNTSAIYSWDGSSGNAYRYEINSSGVYAGVIKNDILYALDANGRLLCFNGGTFIEVARLPNFNRNYYLNPFDTYNDSRFIHPNGMDVVDDKINFLINTAQATYGTPTEEMCPSGIWEYDKDIGLYHKYSLSYYDNAVQNITDYGQSRISVAGGLKYAKSSATSSPTNGILLIGAKYYTDASSTKYGIFYDDNRDFVLKAGYLVTTKIPSSGITDTWQRLVLKYNNLLSASNKIIVKYRLKDEDPIEATITWTSTTTFTTTTDISSYWSSGTGYEVEVVQGTGAGLCSHITNISGPSGGTYTVTVDEIYTGVTSGTAIARFQKWIKLGTVNDTTSTFKIFGLLSSAISNFIQLKIFMLMYGNDELKEIDVQSVVSQSL